MDVERWNRVVLCLYLQGSRLRNSTDLVTSSPSRLFTPRPIFDPAITTGSEEPIHNLPRFSRLSPHCKFTVEVLQLLFRLFRPVTTGSLTITTPTGQKGSRDSPPSVSRWTTYHSETCPRLRDSPRAQIPIRDTSTPSATPCSSSIPRPSPISTFAHQDLTDMPCLPRRESLSTRRRLVKSSKQSPDSRIPPEVPSLGKMESWSWRAAMKVWCRFLTWDLELS